jgi:hypothetical protein
VVTRVHTAARRVAEWLDAPLRYLAILSGAVLGVVVAALLLAGAQGRDVLTGVVVLGVAVWCLVRGARAADFWPWRLDQPDQPGGPGRPRPQAQAAPERASEPVVDRLLDWLYDRLAERQARRAAARRAHVTPVGVTPPPPVRLALPAPIDPAGRCPSCAGCC